MPFSWSKAKSRAKVVKINKEMRCARGGANYNPDFALAHPDEVREAQQKPGLYTKLVNRVTKEVNAKQDLAMQRRLKTIGK